MIKRTNKTLEQSLSKYVDDHQNERKNFPYLVLMAYRSSVLAVTKYSLSHVVLGTPRRLPIDCINGKCHTELLLTPSSFIFDTNREMQWVHHLERAGMEVEQTHQVTPYEYLANGPTYSEGEQVLLFFPTLKKKTLVSTRDPTLTWKFLTI